MPLGYNSRKVTNQEEDDEAEVWDQDDESSTAPSAPLYLQKNHKEKMQEEVFVYRPSRASIPSSSISEENTIIG